MQGPKNTECFRPMLANQIGYHESGKPKYSIRSLEHLELEDRQRHVEWHEKADVLIPCRRCPACLSNRAGEWSMRCYHEDLTKSRGVFATLTYSEANYPGPSLVPKDWKNFIRNLRREFPEEDISFFACGEYGEVFERPHFHACIWGAPIDQGDYFSTSEKGHIQWRSEVLENAWQEKGFATFNKFEPSCAGYVASYVTGTWKDHEASELGPNGMRRDQRVNVETGEVVQLVKPFQRQSQPAIGKAWFEQHKSDLLKGFVTYRGKPRKIPRTYLRWLAEEDPQAVDVIKARAQEFIDARGYFEGDSSWQRLADREQVVRLVKSDSWKRGDA